MILGQAQTTTFKLDLLKGLVNFDAGSPYTYKIALYNAEATINSETSAYTTQDEITGTGYTAGGEVLVPIIGSDPSNNTAYVTFSNVTWDPASFSAAGALIYNSDTNASVAVLSFGGVKTASTTFTIEFPADTSTTAVIRIN